MDIRLLQGNFSKQEAIDILTQFVKVKIQFHEGKIHGDIGEEDVKMRERRIKELQDDLRVLRSRILQQEQPISLEAMISVA